MSKVKTKIKNDVIKLLSSSQHNQINLIDNDDDDFSSYDFYDADAYEEAYILQSSSNYYDQTLNRDYDETSTIDDELSTSNNEVYDYLLIIGTIYNTCSICLE